MNKIKIILIGILSIGFIGIASANPPTEKNTVITCEVKKDTTAVKDELNGKLKTEIKNKTIIIVTNDSAQEVSLSIDTVKVKLAEIEKRLSDKGFILLFPEPVKEEAVEVKPQLPAEKYNPEIDKFLNCEDVSIFRDKFMDLSDNKIHPRSRSYYQLLKNIHILDEKVSPIDSTAINMNTIHTDLDTIGQLIDEINSPNNLLPTLLLDYYKSLVKKYGVIYDKIYPIVNE